MDNDYSTLKYQEPTTDNIAAALRYMDAIVEEAAPDLEALTDTYLVRADTGKLIKTQTEYEYCVLVRIPIHGVPYSDACLLLKKETGKGLRKSLARAKNKRARAARKRNR